MLFQNPGSTYFCYVGVERSYLTYMFPFSGWTLCPSFTQLSYNWLTLLYVDIKDSFIVHHFATRCNWGEKCIVCNFPRILAPTTKRTHFWSCPSNSTLIVSVIDCNYSYPPSCIIIFFEHILSKVKHVLYFHFLGKILKLVNPPTHSTCLSSIWVSKTEFVGQLFGVTLHFLV